MTGSDIALLAALALVVLLVFVLAAAETSLVRVRRSEVVVAAERGDRRTARLAGLVDDLPRVLNAVLLAVLLAQVVAATVAGVLAQRALGNTGVTVGTVVVTIVLFVYGEAIPKTLAVRRPLVTARRLAPLVVVLTRVLRPAVALLTRIADLQLPAGPRHDRVAVSEEELRLLADEAATAGEIDDTDRELIDRAFVLGDLRVDEILVPRIDVVAVADHTTVAEALRVAIAAGHRRLPVYESEIDRITGFVRLRDLAAVASGDPAEPVSAHARDVLAVPESRRVVDLLRDMQESRRHLAVVVDEHGGTAGIVTIEDVVEELVGPIEER